MEIREYRTYNAQEILHLYASVGWTSYTDYPVVLRKGFENSMLTLAAYEGDQLLGVVRAVGDGHTIVFVQDIFSVSGASTKRRRFRTPASHIGQIQPCASDRTGNGQYTENHCVLQVYGLPGDV